MMNRRKLLALLGAAGLNMISGHSASKSDEREMGRKMFSCVPTPQQTEGPYFVDEHLDRADIRYDPSDGSVKEGVPLTLQMHVFSVGKTGCKPLPGLSWTSGSATPKGSIPTSSIPVSTQSGKNFYAAIK